MELALAIFAGAMLAIILRRSLRLRTERRRSEAFVANPAAAAPTIADSLDRARAKQDALEQQLAEDKAAQGRSETDE